MAMFRYRYYFLTLFTIAYGQHSLLQAQSNAWKTYTIINESAVQQHSKQHTVQGQIEGQNEQWWPFNFGAERAKENETEKEWNGSESTLEREKEETEKESKGSESTLAREREETEKESKGSEYTLKFYMPNAKKCEDLKKVIEPRIYPDGELKSFADWLWTWKADQLPEYMEYRLACSNMLVNSPEEADLCYPKCTSVSFVAENAGRDDFHNNQSWIPPACFGVPYGKRNNWWGCEEICLTKEVYEGQEKRCEIQTPYLTGVIWPEKAKTDLGIKTPWGHGWERRTMLVFIGGTSRGSANIWDEKSGRMVERGTVIEAMQAEAGTWMHPTKAFESFAIDEKGSNDWYDWGRTAGFFRDTWNHYSHATFSWQPQGDTPLRRALFDSVLFGCIPVISSKGVEPYKRLFKGALWKDFALDKVFVVTPANIDGDGRAILQMLSSISPEEIEERRRRLQSIAPHLQWGPNSGGDALQIALKKFNGNALVEG